jgi:glycosyltransferase involved in cell wall biosynthesis
MNETAQPWLSIITVCFNDAQNLSRTLKNIRDQRSKTIQLIVVDGDSNDDTKSVIRSYRDVITDYLCEKDDGLYYAMNKGIALAKGEYVVFLNAGDVFHDPQVIAFIHNHHRNEDILYGDAFFVDQEGDFKSRRHKKIPKKLNWLSFRDGMVICHQALIVKTAKALLYDTQYEVCADLDWAIRITKEAESTRNLGITVCDFQRGGISDKRRSRALLERWHILQKHFGLKATLWSHIKVPMVYLLWKWEGIRRRYPANDFQIKIKEADLNKNERLI